MCDVDVCVLCIVWVSHNSLCVGYNNTLNGKKILVYTISILF